MDRRRILIVEDEFLVAYEIRMCLEERGYEVCGMVGSGEEAVAVAERELPHLVLMDVSLKGAMGGIEAARRIVSRHRVPIVFMTGLPTAQVVAQANDLEPAGCFSKPVDLNDLCALVDRLVSRKSRRVGTPAAAPAAAPHPASTA